MKSKKINRNKKDVLSKDDFKTENIKERVTAWIDEDVVNWLRSESAKLGIGYQTLMNMKLRNLVKENKSLEERIAALENKFAAS